MASTWQIKVSTVATTERADGARERIADAVRSEVEAVCGDLLDRANALIAVECLASPSVDPVPPPGSSNFGEPSLRFTDWLVTVESYDGRDAVVEMRLLDLCERLEQEIEDVALVELTRTAGRRTTYLGEMAAGYRIIVALPTDRPLSDLPTARDSHWRCSTRQLRAGRSRVA